MINQLIKSNNNQLVMTISYDNMTPEQQIKADQQIAEYFRKELSKPQPLIIYLPTAQNGSEPFIGPLEQQ